MAPGAITPRAARRALHFRVLVALSKNKYRIGGVTLLALVLSGAGLSYAKRWNARLRRKSARCAEGSLWHVCRRRKNARADINCPHLLPRAHSEPRTAP